MSQVLSGGSALLEPLETFGRETHQGLSAVVRVGGTTDQASFQQRCHYGAHGLWAHSFGSRETGDRSRSALFQPKHNRHLRRRQVAVFPVFTGVPFELAKSSSDLEGECGSEFGFRRRCWTAH